jgi:integrase/recombinase XerD
MKRDPSTGAPNFFRFARDYLHGYMPKVQRLSPKTIEAYRISLECFLDYLTRIEHVERAHVSFDHFERQHLKAWLTWMVERRHYAPTTIALRLSTIKAFLAYSSHEDITLVALSQDPEGTRQSKNTHRVPHRTRNASRPCRVHRHHEQVTQKPDAAHPPLRHRRPRR